MKLKKVKEFWLPLITNKQGNISMRKVWNELHDYMICLEEVPKVYCEITGNRMSKPTYSATDVIAEHDEVFFDKYTIRSDVKMLLKEAKTLKDLKASIREYLEIN
jgi:hypothetical protein